MENLFEQPTVQGFIDRINRLTPESAAQWGKMHVDQMLAHCQKPLQIANGSLKPKINPIVKFLFGKSAKKQLINDPQFKKSLPTFSEAIIVDRRKFDEEKQKLVGMIQEFQKNGPAGIIKDPHPFFGVLTIDEWNLMQVKHLDHHLRQFGV